MEWKDFRLTKRLGLKVDVVEEIYAMIAEIDAVKNGWQISVQCQHHLLVSGLQRFSSANMIP